MILTPHIAGILSIKISRTGAEYYPPQPERVRQPFGCDDECGRFDQGLLIITTQIERKQNKIGFWLLVLFTMPESNSANILII